MAQLSTSCDGASAEIALQSDEANAAPPLM
jgi:hypothetical protein